MLIRPPVVTIDREDFKLTFWKIKGGMYSPIKTFGITVGMIGHDTPTGLYFVEGKTKTPDWKAPDADWVQPPEDRGKIFPFGSDRNPFASGFISIDSKDGIGIHDVKFDPMIGTRSSHGCIRMRTDSLQWLYRNLPMGAPVFVY